MVLDTLLKDVTSSHYVPQTSMGHYVAMYILSSLPDCLSHVHRHMSIFTCYLSLSYSFKKKVQSPVLSPCSFFNGSAAFTAGIPS